MKNLGGIVKQTAVSVMIGHRAFTLGARDIASDVIQGVMETSEQVLVEGDDYTLLNEDYLEETKDSQN